MIGEVLRAWREKRDLTVRDLAPMLGISAATISRIERGGQMDAPTQIKLIVFLFGCASVLTERSEFSASLPSAAPKPDVSKR